MHRLGPHLPYLLVCLAVSLAIRLTVGVGVVSGLSMWPALNPGDVVVYVRGLPPVAGSLVVAELPGHGLIIKRVAAVGPQTLGDHTPVAAGSCYLVGDNMDNSYDSRYFGALPADLVIGRVVVIWAREPSPRSYLRLRPAVGD